MQKTLGMIPNEVLTPKEERQFVVNPKYCEKYGISKQAARNIAAKMLLDLQLKQLYDTNLSIKENLESLKIRVSKSAKVASIIG